MISAIKKKFFEYHLKSKLKDQEKLPVVFNFEKAETVGILFDASEKESLKIIQDFVQTMKDSKKSVKQLGFIDAKNVKDIHPFPFFTQNNLNWFNVPTSPEITDFIQTKFDILINLCPKEKKSLEYISALSKSKFRIGRYISDKTFCYDFMINITDGIAQLEFIKQVQQFLKPNNES